MLGGTELNFLLFLVQLFNQPIKTTFNPSLPIDKDNPPKPTHHHRKTLKTLTGKKVKKKNDRESSECGLLSAPPLTLTNEPRSVSLNGVPLTGSIHGLLNRMHHPLIDHCLKSIHTLQITGSGLTLFL